MKRVFLSLAVAALCVGCAAPATTPSSEPTPVVTASTIVKVQNGIAAARVTVTQVRALGRALLDAKKIGSADARNVQRQADTFDEGLGVADALAAATPDAAASKLQATVVLLNTLNNYLKDKQ